MKNTANIYMQDCVAGMAERLQESSVDLCVSSIPFGALFQYSGKPEDIGNNQDGTDMRAGQFGLHMRFFIAQLQRVMKPGRNICIHIQQLLRYLNQHGYMGRRDFRGAVVDMFSAGGLEWIGEVVIPKNPQVIAQRLSLHSLMFVTGTRDATKLAPAVNDYVMIFQKPGDAEPPVKSIRKAMGAEVVNPDGWVSTEEWVQWAKGVWTDIEELDVLDGWKSARETDEEKHVCPLQLEVIRRCVSLYTNPGEVVLDPFMGIGSTAYVCLQGKTKKNLCLRSPRQVIGFELKESYYDLCLRNLDKLEREQLENSRDLWTIQQEVKI